MLYPATQEDSKGQCPLHWGQILPFTVIWRTVVGNWMWDLEACHFEAVSSTLSHSASNDQVPGLILV